MEPNHVFKAALKIVGVLTIIWSFTKIAEMATYFLSIYNDSALMQDHMLFSFRFSLLFMLLVPILLFIIGVYLLKNGESIIKLAFKEIPKPTENSVETVFRLFMKIVGFILIIVSIPKGLHFISAVIYASSIYSPDTNMMLEPILNHLIPAVVYFILGLYLLISGNLFYKLAFSKKVLTEKP